MKKLLVIFVIVATGAISAFAHDAEGGSTVGLFGLKAEHLHVLLNPLPVYGLFAGAAVLLTGLLARSRTTRNTGLILTILCAASAWPVLLYGQHGYNHLAPQLDTESKQWLDAHMERAERFIYVFYLTALLGVAAIVLQKKFPKVAPVLAWVTCLSAMISLGIGGWISRAGGQISHSEFRGEEPPPASSGTSHTHEHGGATMPMTNTSGGHQHGMSEQSHEKMQPADTSGHKHETTPENPAGKSPMPDTMEGVWKSIHEHHGELESKVSSKQFKEVQSLAGMISDLAKRLVEIARPDHKPAVQSDVNKVTHALDELKSSAETGSDTVMKTRFKEFDEALNQLEEQMKKQ